MNREPREVIADSPMSALQIIVVALTIALNALDGFDVLSISFAFAAGFTLTVVATALALGSLISALVLILLKVDHAR